MVIKSERDIEIEKIATKKGIVIPNMNPIREKEAKKKKEDKEFNKAIIIGLFVSITLAGAELLSEFFKFLIRYFELCWLNEISEVISKFIIVLILWYFIRKYLNKLK